MGITEAVRYCTTCRAVYRSEFARCPNDGGLLQVADADPLIGTTVGQYTVDAFVGGGAMGRVYRCHHALLTHKQFALKVLRGDLSATVAMRLRFTQEAEAASRLSHPNIVSVLDFGRTEDGLLYLAMEFVEGASLASLVTQPMAPLRVVRLAQALARGLAHAHEHGFVHRDLKPDNIIVVRDAAGNEVPRIVDFGLAIRADPDSDSARITTAGAAVGTPVYAAPEQLGADVAVDHRADMFALGVTLFELLAGRVPFDGNILEVLHQNLSGERPAIAARSPGVVVPPRLERLVHKLMAPEADARPASITDVLAELAIIELELEHGSAITVTPSSVVTEKMRRSRPSRAPWVAVAAVALLGAGGVAAYALLANRGETAPVAQVAPSPISQPVVQRLDAGQIAADVAEVAVEPAPPEVVAAPEPVVKKGKRGRTLSSRPSRHPATHADQAEVTEPTTTIEAPVAQAEPPAPAERKVTVPVDVPAPHDVGPHDVPAPPPKLVTSAKVALDGLSVRGALTTAQVRRGLDRSMPALRACYAPAASAAKKSPSVAVRVRFEIDESQHARAIQTTESELPGLAACVKTALAASRAEAAPDVGTVDVTFVVAFVPEGA